MRKAVNATTFTSFRGAPGKVSRRPVWEPLPYTIAPPPKASTKPRTKSKTRRGFAAVLTSSPYNAHLHNIKKAKAEDIDVKCKKTNDIKKSKVTEQA